MSKSNKSIVQQRRKEHEMLDDHPSAEPNQLSIEWLRSFEGFEHWEDKQLQEALAFIELLCTCYYDAYTHHKHTTYENDS